MLRGTLTLTGGDAAEEALLDGQPPGHDHGVIAGHLRNGDHGEGH